MRKLEVRISSDSAQLEKLRQLALDHLPGASAPAPGLLEAAGARAQPGFPKQTELAGQAGAAAPLAPAAATVAQGGTETKPVAAQQTEAAQQPAGASGPEEAAGPAAEAVEVEATAPPADPPATSTQLQAAFDAISAQAPLVYCGGLSARRSR